MAKGGSRGRRSYTRDARGRFASTPGGGAKPKPKPPRTSFRQRQAVSLARSRGQTGRLGSATKAAKARLKATRARTGAGASPQQKAALTRAKRMAAALAGERRVKTAGRTGILRGVAAKGVKKAAGTRVRPGVAPAKPVSARPTSKVVPRSERRRVAGPRKAGTIAKPKGLKPGALADKGGKKPAPRPSTAPRPALDSGQVAGARKRASETPEAFNKRKLDDVRFKLNQLSERRGLQESALKRRRGRLEGDDRKKAVADLVKTKRSLARLKDAEQMYSTAVTRKQDQRNWDLSMRTRRKAPADKRTAMNRLVTMNRRVSYLRKNELLPLDRWGRRQFTGKLKQASEDRIAALAGISGQRFTYRSKRRATIEQRVRANRVLDLSRKRYHGGQSGDDYVRYGIKTKRDTRKRKGDTIRATSRQGNLLTGGFERVRSGRFRPLAGRTWF